MSAADRDPPDLKVGAGDTAQATTELPLPAHTVFDFLAGIERPFRLNPQLAISAWVPAKWGFRLIADNESNGQHIDVSARVELEPARHEIFIRYDSGLKQATHFAVEPCVAGAKLIVTEHYPHIEDPADPRVTEVDKSLVPWVTALRRHLLARTRWGNLPGWRWWNERFMPGMPPRQRRIVRLLVWSTVLEFCVFLVLVVALRFAA